MATTNRKTPANNWNYEATVRQIEEILNLIERGEMDLADVFEQFSVAITYLKQCEQFLSERQTQVGLLIETLSDTHTGAHEDF
jgi:exodeoxyribonuclease VII small subunit